MFKALTSHLRQGPKSGYILFTNGYSYCTFMYEKTCGENIGCIIYFALLTRNNVKLNLCNLSRSIELPNLGLIKIHFTLFMNIKVKMHTRS